MSGKEFMVLDRFGPIAFDKLYEKLAPKMSSGRYLIIEDAIKLITSVDKNISYISVDQTPGGSTEFDSVNDVKQENRKRKSEVSEIDDIGKNPKKRKITLKKESSYKSQYYSREKGLNNISSPYSKQSYRRRTDYIPSQPLKTEESRRWSTGMKNGYRKDVPMKGIIACIDVTPVKKSSRNIRNTSYNSKKKRILSALYNKPLDFDESLRNTRKPAPFGAPDIYEKRHAYGNYGENKKITNSSYFGDPDRYERKNYFGSSDSYDSKPNYFDFDTVLESSNPDDDEIFKSDDFDILPVDLPHESFPKEESTDIYSRRKKDYFDWGDNIKSRNNYTTKYKKKQSGKLPYLRRNFK
eukprot:TRINITY_DN4521_c0_g2_i2.p1 TRINITY_DN4521_c0_g2~~TRINITY_DN4521_c0_g2_i2.p1  ORF type:complete len:353 (-),score=76.34 TRINITY_DN4521_c0_g2_i2:130-1188(-)